MKNFIKNSLFLHVPSDISMTQAETIKDAFKLLQERYNTPDFRHQLQEYSKIIKFIFTDMQNPYIIEINRGKINELSDKITKTPDITISIDSAIFLDILHKKINPIMAFSTGKLKITGELTDLLKLQKLL